MPARTLPSLSTSGAALAEIQCSFPSFLTTIFSSFVIIPLFTAFVSGKSSMSYGLPSG